ncbi:DUF2339 domain-containing protein [Piscinibacter terrae]|uniref:DUF2339 domain-containing protein n=1 Tax=Piscinibacter terrae TaxID=2496871 RepID=A0A3N7JSR7_9BURK|nr:DUF2339 domain-containing protein [Albitalea terrae]RQP22035.1 DUF2339 domain-containing protein [Albitalea terrae]
MVFVFVLLGALLGGVMAGGTGALVGAVVLPVAWVSIRNRMNDDGDDKPKPSAVPQVTEAQAKAAVPTVQALAARVQALEEQVAQLRRTIAESRPEAVADATAQEEHRSASVLAAMQPPAVATIELPGPAPTVSMAQDLAMPAAAAPIEEVAPAEEPEFDLQPMAATLSESASVTVEQAQAFDLPEAPEANKEQPAWTAPAPRPPAPPRAPTPPLRDQLPPFISNFIFGGNTIVKVGVLILFLGLAFLLRYAAERVTVPIELRYAGVAMVGAFLLGIGWRLRSRSAQQGGSDYGLILQGAGIGVFYLTALAAIKLNPLLTPAVAFTFMALVSVLGAVLAVTQNAPWLALVSVAEGFAAPVLVSTGGGNHVALFSYMLILDVGIFLMAWFRAWRPLNLVGAVATFSLASAWASEHYSDALYASVQFFLIVFFLLFTFIGVLFARRALAQGTEPDESLPLAERAAQALNLVGRVDSTLTFGIPLAAYGLQYLLVQDRPWGPAWSALGFAVFYLLLGGLLLRGGHRRYSLLGEAYVIVSVIFGTLTIPLALEGVWTGATWAVEAAGMYWLGARQRRTYARLFSLAVLAGAVVRLVTSMDVDLQAGTPLLVGSTLGMAMLAASVVAMLLVHRKLPASERNGIESMNDALLPLLAAAAVTSMPWMLLAPRWAGVCTSWLAVVAMLSRERLKAPVLRFAAAVMHVIALASLVLSLRAVDGAAMLASGLSGLVSAVLIGAGLLATAALELRAQWLKLKASAAPTWSLSGSLALVAGIGVMSGSLLFVMPADRAALVWPWLGLGTLWAGLRLSHPALSLSWLALQVVAGIATILYGPALWDATVNGSPWMGPLVLVAAALLAGDWLQRRTAPEWVRWPATQWAMVGWTMAWWIQLLPPEFDRQLQHMQRSALWPAVMVLWVLFSTMLMVGLARWRRWTAMGQASVVALPAWMLLAAVGPVAHGASPSASLGWLAWPLALAWHIALLKVQEESWDAKLLRPLHVLGFWFFLLLGARECQLLMQGLGEPGAAWSVLGFMLVPAAVLVGITRPALLKRWPIAGHAAAYLVAGAAPVALYLLLWLWVGNTQAGSARPLPYVPLLNPLEMGQGLVLLALALWFKALPEEWRARVSRQAMHAVLAATAFALYTGLVLRTCHHWAGVPWDAGDLFQSRLAQAALSVAWSLVAVGAMLLGNRKLSRTVWGAGASLLAVVVAKLFLVELADHGGLYRIVSFIVVGVLLLVVGYFAPLPPSSTNDKPATA